MSSLHARSFERLGGGGLVDLVFKIAGPTSLVTALLFYFGWARAQASMRIYGLHESLLDYSVTDMLLRSVGAMYVPLGLLAATSAGVGLLHARAPSLVRTAQH